MAENGIKNARVRATGNMVQVYLHFATSKWICAKDCKTEYAKTELEFI